MNFTNKVLDFCHINQLPEPGSKLIIGISGGGDSVALLHYLSRAGYQCIAAHCNFHLRNDESDEDEQFVRQLAADWQIPFRSVDFDTRGAALRDGISIEMAARKLRYEWFENLMVEYQADAIAVAHHLDDSIETFFINLSRGSGIRGLTGIKAVSGNVIRPFLSVTRLEIEQYLKENNLSFRTDSTNCDTSIVRNNIRHKIIPLFESINPSFKHTMFDNMGRLADTSALTDTYISSLQTKWMSVDNGVYTIEIAGLRETANSTFILYEILAPFGFGQAVVGDISESLNAESGKQFFSGSHRLIKDRSTLIISPREQTNQQTYRIDENLNCIHLPVSLLISHPKPVSAITISPAKDRAWLDADQLEFPLELRHPQAGDYFYPFGGKGKKKLSDFFIDQKFDLSRKEKCWLLLSGQKIVWIVGIRTDNRFRISSTTKNVIEMRIF
jgi:tRNA(Ile)-lysidine synthase